MRQDTLYVSIGVIIASFILPIAWLSAPPSHSNQLPNYMMSASMDNHTAVSQASIRRDKTGHYWANANINGSEIRFLVDTGASSVALSRQDAKAIGLSFSEEDFTWTAKTASGSVRYIPITLESLIIADIHVKNIDAAIIDSDNTHSLLGMSFINKMRSVELKGEHMTLRQ